MMLGIVRQRHTAFPFAPMVLEVCDPQGVTQLVVKAPCCPCACCDDVPFPYFSVDESVQVRMLAECEAKREIRKYSFI